MKYSTYIHPFVYKKNLNPTIHTVEVIVLRLVQPTINKNYCDFGFSYFVWVQIWIFDVVQKYIQYKIRYNTIFFPVVNKLRGWRKYSKMLFFRVQLPQWKVNNQFLYSKERMTGEPYILNVKDDVIMLWFRTSEKQKPALHTSHQRSWRTFHILFPFITSF